MKILIIEDEKLLADSLKALLKSKGFDTEAVYDGETGAEYALTGIYDLLILDAMIPGMDSFEVAKQVRRERCCVPILMLTARSGVEDRIEGLNAGADYYLTKPFDTRELLACINALLPFEPLFFEKGMGLTSDIEDGILIFGDRTRLCQVVDILLDNALKYAAPGSVVSVGLKRQNGGCLLTVTSAGEPISREDRKNIFKRFYRVDKSRHDGQSYGLGLSIADSIIRQHKGRIWAESGDGANVFLVQLKTCGKSRG
ncbi:MAG: response regulator [Oscillospiraceae bacterium]